MQISSSITPHSNVTYLEKICEILGGKRVTIDDSNDYLCMQCTSYIIRMDKLENEVQHIKNHILLQVLNKLDPLVQAVESIEVVIEIKDKPPTYIVIKYFFFYL